MSVKCKICDRNIVEEELKHVYYDPDYPLIDIGPYCAECMGTIRICNGCHEPHQIDVSIKYFNGGRFFCATCAEGLSICSCCGSETTNFIIVDGKKYCETCYNKYFQKCDCCDTLQHKNNFVHDGYQQAQYPGLFKKYKDCCIDCFNEKKSKFLKVEVGTCENCKSFYRKKKNNDPGYCPRCVANLPHCGVCGKQHHEIITIPVDSTFGGPSTQYACKTCVSTLKKCDCCKRYTKTPVTTKGIFKDIFRCTVCRDRSVGQCSTCLKVSELIDGKCTSCLAFYSDSNRCTRCGRLKDSSGKCRVCETTHIYNYSTKPHPFFMYSKKDIGKKNTIFFGIENEITFSTGNKRDDALGDIYRYYGPDILLAKSDASISDYGFEVVTQPMTLEHFSEMNITSMFPDTMKNSTSCGMHVHVGRSAFVSDLHLFKVCQFVHKNTKFIDTISERSMNHYSGGFEDRVSKSIKESKRGNGYRNLRVNLTNQVTVEFRMFAQATKETQMRQRVEFLHALIEWTKGISLKESSVNAFKSYVNSNKKLYPNLVTFLSAQ